MAKKILILSASPRKGGNSDLLCDQFLRGAKEAGHEAEKIFLREKEVNHCVACGACLENGGTCVQKDDMAEVLDKMTAADVIAMATPVYFYTMNYELRDRRLEDGDIPKSKTMSHAYEMGENV